ncbi:MAG: hypothetical protein LJE61_02100 [Thiocapsa sp.]|nr:hypothetical protein [Thiocapsa sp.]MCG6897256.1 hypothetical protein [Thiocapsa sp.]MCG6983980.1 hypothetical protein [Thiocapsa sp.]
MAGKPVTPHVPDPPGASAPAIPAMLRNLILIDLAAAILVALPSFGGNPPTGSLRVLFALPWRPCVSNVAGLLGLESPTLNPALLAIGAGINAAMPAVIGGSSRGGKSP